jgi:hypothetical protein
MAEFKTQLPADSQEKVSTLITELRELATKSQAGDESVTAEMIKEKIGETQTASLGLFQKVRPYDIFRFEARVADHIDRSTSNGQRKLRRKNPPHRNLLRILHPHQQTGPLLHPPQKARRRTRTLMNRSLPSSSYHAPTFTA